MADNKKPAPFVCPDVPKGQRCPVCGSAYICMRWREKQTPQRPATPPHPSRETSMTLDEMAERAQRHLDGMTVNKDAMARDVLQLVAAIKVAQQRSGRQPGSFAAAFDDIFGEIFRGR